MKTTLILILLLNSLLFSQEISQMNVIGNGSFLRSELIDRNITDANGEICAGLMIQTDLTGLSYDSNNGIVKVNHNKGEDILFLSPNERVVKILKSGFKPLQIILSEFSVDLKSGQMWKLEVTGNKIGDLIPITLLSKPSGATVFIDGKNKGVGTIFQVAEGKHEVKFERKGSNTLTDIINVSSENILFSYQLDVTQLQVVTITSKPDGATVLMDGQIVGTTDMQKFLAPGTYTLTFQKEGHITQDFEIGVQRNNQNKFNVELKTLAKIVGDLQFSIKPFKARVNLYRDSIIVESWQGLKILNNLLAGEYKISASDLNCKSISKNIIIKDGEITTINLTLKELSKEEKRIKNAKLLSRKMIFVKGGDFKMGDNDGNKDETPRHSVTVNDFLISEYEITNVEYNKFCFDTGRDELEINEDELYLPVINVTWNDAVAYCSWVSGRLPTEAEWEFAAKGGYNNDKYYFSGSHSLNAVAWYKSNSNKRTHKVGTKQSNKLGIYDMSGNVWEWCSDWYQSNYYETRTNDNPQGPYSGNKKVMRGGSWLDGQTYSIVTTRGKKNPKDKFKNVGFRVVKDIKNK